MEVENFVLKMAAEFPSRRDQLIFLINNYDMMLSVLMVSFHRVAQLLPVHHTCLRRSFLITCEELKYSPWDHCFSLVCPGEGSR